MHIFIDSTVLFNSILKNNKGTRLKTLLNHAKNDNHTFTSSLTVYGEIIQVCMREKRDDDLHSILSLIRELDVQPWLPNPQLRNCCKCLDKLDKDNRVGLNDRTHLAYSKSYGEDEYFLTNDEALTHFPIEKCKCKKCKRESENQLAIINPDKLRDILHI